MTVTKEAFVDLQEKYNKVEKLIKEDSKLDPETQPYLSKYSARQILIGMKANIENLLRNQVAETQEHIKLTAMLGIVYLYLGTIGIDTDELSTGEKHLEKCKEVIENYQLKPEFIMVTLNMYNQFGLLWSRKDPEISKTYLEKAEEFYLAYKKLGITPVNIHDVFQVNSEAYSSEETTDQHFENTYTLTLYYMAQIYGALKDALKSSVYCHVTLKRQLEMDYYEPIDWALNAATLSQFFMEKNGFRQARHHLAASSYVLNKYEIELNANTEMSEAFDAKMEVFKHRSADVARCWAKYGLLLLSKSKERLLNHTDDIETKCSMSPDLAKLELLPDSTVTSEDLQNLYFTSVDLTSYENQVAEQFILTFEDAKKVFLNIQMWLNKAHEYYNLNNLASDYIEIVLDQSQMYFNLLFFEDSSENQAKLHKRRIDMLENVIDKVNPHYYLNYCRQIWYELAQTYSDILDIKSEKLRDSKERPKPQALSKINSLVEKSISRYNTFINSYKENALETSCAKINDDVEKPFLQAYFHIAALHNRYITLNKQIQLQNVELSLKYYKLIADYCDKHVKARELIPMEYGICREMVSLLPIKIAKLKLNVS